MKHPLQRLAEGAALHGGLWQQQASHWSFCEKRNRTQRARNLRHLRSREERRRLIDGLIIFVAATQEVPDRATIKSVLSQGQTSKPAVTKYDLQSLL